MNLILARTDLSSDGIFGELRDEVGNVIAATLEHAYEQNGQIMPKLPAGAFRCVRRVSPHFGYELFWVTDVPGHDYIEIHIGNLQKDSSGCVLLGLRRDGIALRGSKLAFDAFMHLQRGVDEFTLTVI